MDKSSIKPLHLILLCVLFAFLIWSFISPRDRLTWFMEVTPAIIILAVVILTYDRFRLSDLTYILITVQSVIIMIGGHYTYEEVPWFNWLRDALGLARNHYDRLGHFIQGFGPAIIAREVLLRTTPLRRGNMLYFLVVSVCLAMSAFYELIEWGIAVGSGGGASAFLGTQGDVWDTQWDMFMALLGANIGLILLKARHDRSMKKDGLYE
ncbi:MAG TPA: DUF2238 domain-containing protein [Bacillota bacterium]|nr:DUF2238 domain-containing protein [Bacillota bacterium]